MEEGERVPGSQSYPARRVKQSGIRPLTTEELIIVQFPSNLEKKHTGRKRIWKKKNTGRKRPTIVIRLGFLIENFFVKLYSQVYRDSHTNPYIFVAFPSQ